MSCNTITVHCSLFTNTVPTQNYECRISDSDKQAGKMTETFVKTLTKTATQTSIETPNETEKRHRLSDCKT